MSHSSGAEVHCQSSRAKIKALAGTAVARDPRGGSSLPLPATGGPMRPWALTSSFQPLSSITWPPCPRLYSQLLCLRLTRTPVTAFSTPPPPHRDNPRKCPHLSILHHTCKDPHFLLYKVIFTGAGDLTQTSLGAIIQLTTHAAYIKYSPYMYDTSFPCEYITRDG